MLMKIFRAIIVVYYRNSSTIRVVNIETFILSNTSGSTGKPKNIKLEKEALVNSSYMTRDYFNLVAGQSAISFLPLNFIAGKMMLIRAMVLGLDLHLFAPTSNPSKFIDKKYFFSAVSIGNPHAVFFIKNINKINNIV